jgi:nitrile hydratase
VSNAFKVGQRVLVKDGDPPVHIRTPFFLRGKSGVVETIHGEFRNPEELAYGKEGLPEKPLYLVRFLQTEVWADYRGAPGDTVSADIYEHWLDAE